jgi:hypothetical protein
MMDFIIGVIYWALVLGGFGASLMFLTAAVALIAWVFLRIRNHIRSKQ